MYDKTLRLLARRGFYIGFDAYGNDWRTMRAENSDVLASWAAIYRDPAEHWTLY